MSTSRLPIHAPHRVQIELTDLMYHELRESNNPKMDRYFVEAILDRIEAGDQRLIQFMHPDDLRKSK